MIFLDIQCVNRDEGNENCDSEYQGDVYPAFSDSAKGVTAAYKKLEKELYENGWKKRNEEWCCPSCLDFLGQ